MGSNALAITTANFEEEVTSAQKPVLLDFTASWCPPCQRLAPVIDRLAEKYAGKVTVGKVDVDESQDIARKYGIESVPTILFFNGGELIDTVQGYQPESIFVAKLDGLIE